MGTVVILPKGARMPNKKILNTVIVGVLLLLILGMVNPFVIVGAGERGVILRFGAVEERILMEGVHFLIPFVEHAVVVDVKIRKYDVDSDAYSHDLQNVKAKIVLNYHVDPDHVNGLWQQLGRDFEHRIIEPAVQESVKATTAKYTAEQLIEQREQVRDEIKAMLIDRLQNRFLMVDTFSIVNFSFSDAYEHAIEEKQVKEQEYLKEQNTLKIVETQAQQRIASAKAEAESIRITGEALRQNSDLVGLEAVKKWDGKLPEYMMGNSGSVPFISIPQSREGAH